MSRDDDKRYNDPEEDMDELDTEEIEESGRESNRRDTSLREDVSDAKKKVDRAKKEYNELQKQRLEQLDRNASKISKEISKDGIKKGIGKEATQKGAKETGKEITKQGVEEVGKTAVRKGTKQVGKEVAKEGAKQGALKSAEAAGMAIPYLNVAIVALEAVNAIKKLGTKIKSKITGKTEEELKEEKKKKKKLILFFLIGLLFIHFIDSSKFVISETVITDIDSLVRRREVRYGEDSSMIRTNNSGAEEHYKPLILFSADEYKETIYTDYENDMCYKTMIKELYNGELNNILLAKTTFKEGEDTEENRYLVSTKYAQRYLEAEKSNFNKINWIRYTNKDAYTYEDSVTFSSLEDFLSNDVGPSYSGTGEEKRDVATRKVLDSELKVPDLSKYDILPGASNEEKAMLYIDMLAPYMQKWVIPWSILVDTDGDYNFVQNVLNDMYHLAKVYLYELNQENKTTYKYYYLEVEQRYTWEIWKHWETEEEITDENGVTTTVTIEHEEKVDDSGEHILDEVTNSKDHRPGTQENGSESDVSEWADLPDASGTTYYYIKNVKLHYDLKNGPVVANGADGTPMVKEIKVTREIVPYKYVPKVKYIEDLYYIFSADYRVIPIDESSAPNYSNGADVGDVVLDNAANGIGLVTLKENWKESFETLDSKVETYKVSYYTEDDYKRIGRRVSRIEWKQDWGNVVNVNGVSLEDTIAADLGTGTGGAVTHEALMEWIVPLAKQLQKESGLLPSLTIAQKIQESGWDWTDSVIETECHNYWGMKAGSNWDGDYMVFDTREDDGTGNLYEIQDAFRKYDSDEAGFSGRGEWFWSYSRYSNVLTACLDGDWEAAVDDFKTNGYATDITYAETLKTLIEQNQLYQYDNDPEYQFNGVAPDYAKYDPRTGESLDGSGSGVNTGIMSGVEFETDPEYSKYKENPVYPEKTAAEFVSAYRKYANGKGYSYDDLYFAFYQMDKYYPETDFSTGSGGSLTNSGTPGSVDMGVASEAAKDKLEEVIANWPDDLDQRRIDLIMYGSSLVQVVPYVWGGGHGNFEAQLNNPTGLDCSGFTSWCYAKAGMNFGCICSQDFKNNSNFRRISKSELIPGDVGVNSHHVGIYIGKDSSGRDTWMHAQSTDTGIVINNYTTFDTFVRYKDF